MIHVIKMCSSRVPLDSYPGVYFSEYVVDCGHLEKLRDAENLNAEA